MTTVSAAAAAAPSRLEVPFVHFVPSADSTRITLGVQRGQIPDAFQTHFDNMFFLRVFQQDHDHRHLAIGTCLPPTSCTIWHSTGTEAPTIQRTRDVTMVSHPGRLCPTLILTSPHKPAQPVMCIAAAPKEKDTHVVHCASFGIHYAFDSKDTGTHINEVYPFPGRWAQWGARLFGSADDVMSYPSPEHFLTMLDRLSAAHPEESWGNRTHFTFIDGEIPAIDWVRTIAEKGVPLTSCNGNLGMQMHDVMLHGISTATFTPMARQALRRGAQSGLDFFESAKTYFSNITDATQQASAQWVASQLDTAQQNWAKSWGKYFDLGTAGLHVVQVVPDLVTQTENFFHDALASLMDPNHETSPYVAWYNTVNAHNAPEAKDALKNFDKPMQETAVTHADAFSDFLAASTKLDANHGALAPVLHALGFTRKSWAPRMTRFEKQCLALFGTPDSGDSAGKRVRS